MEVNPPHWLGKSNDKCEGFRGIHDCAQSGVLAAGMAGHPGSPGFLADLGADWGGHKRGTVKRVLPGVGVGVLVEGRRRRQESEECRSCRRTSWLETPLETSDDFTATAGCAWVLAARGGVLHVLDTSSWVCPCGGSTALYR